MTRMFPFITKTWNPLGGKCRHDCLYCWAQGPKGLVNRYGMKKYKGEPRLYERELQKAFAENDFVFVCDMCDLFGKWVPKEIIQKILDAIAQSPATFLLLTKNPSRYLEFQLPQNCVAGATVETDMKYQLANAPSRMERLNAMANLQHPRKMLSIEPIMEFSPTFLNKILAVNPEFIAIGYDNYNNKLREPKLEITQILIEGLEVHGIKVIRKTLREKVRVKQQP